MMMSLSGLRGRRVGLQRLDAGGARQRGAAQLDSLAGAQQR